MPTTLGKSAGPYSAEAAAQARADFVHAIVQLNLTAKEAARLAECLTGRPFEDCGAAEICSAAEQVLSLVRCTVKLGAEQAHE
jgi:hypothetical protein